VTTVASREHPSVATTVDAMAATKAAWTGAETAATKVGESADGLADHWVDARAGCWAVVRVADSAAPMGVELVG
jgi:hypothetical protein